MKTMLIQPVCFLILSSMSIAFAGENDKAGKKENQSEPNIGVTVIHTNDGEKSRKEKTTPHAKQIIIAINDKIEKLDLSETADESSEEATQIMNAPDDKSQVKTTIIGHGMIVGPDGEKKTFQFGSSEESEQALQELPEEVRTRLEQVMKNAKNRAAFGQVLKIGPDGVAKSIEVDLNRIKPSEEFNLQGDAMIFIEEAIRGTGTKGMPEFDQSLESLGSSGGRAIIMLPDGSPKEVTVDIEEVEKALKDAMTNKTLPKILELYSGDQAPDKKSRNKTSGKMRGKSVSDKLDLILKRLDEIETRVRSLENK
jgi:hypothetical protein